MVPWLFATLVLCGVVSVAHAGWVDMEGGCQADRADLVLFLPTE